MSTSRAEDIYQRIQKEGEKAIDEFILTQKSEELFLDFKTSANQGKSNVLDNNDRKNLAKAISGFGNSEGGVIVWGVDCRNGVNGADVARTKFPIVEVKRFTSFLENAISGCTIPPHSGVKNHAVVVKNNSGFVATYIPKSELTPHQDIYEKRYYIRAGSNFIPTSHDILAGLFGKRPQPNVFNMYLHTPLKIIEDSLIIDIGFMLHNAGRSVAKDLFLIISVVSSPGDNCEISFRQNDANWEGYWVLGRKFNMISKVGFRIPPDAEAEPAVANFVFKPPFKRNLKINVTCGCEGGIIYKSAISNSCENIQKEYDKIYETNAKSALTKEELQKYVENLIGKPEDTEKNI